LRMGPVRTRKS